METWVDRTRQQRPLETRYAYLGSTKSFPASPREPSKKASETGSKPLSGTAGVPGRLTHVSETLALLRSVASSTPEDGLNTFQGRLQGISSRLNAGPEEGYILTVYFDSQTSQRLRESLSGFLGNSGTVPVGSSITMVLEEPPTT